MSFSSLTDAEIDLGIDKAYKKFGCTIMRRNLSKVSDHLQNLRYEGKPFEEALRETLDFFTLTDDRREWYKTALGAAFSSRSKPMHKGKTKKLRPVQSNTTPAIVNKQGQYGLPLPS